MSLSPKQLESELLELDETVRAHLLARILATYRQRAEDPEILQAWAEEAQRRDAEMEAGDEPGIPAEDVFQRIRRCLPGSG